MLRKLGIILLVLLSIQVISIAATNYTITEGIKPQADLSKVKRAEKITVAYLAPAMEYNFYLEFGKGLEQVIKSSGNEYFMKAPQKDADYETQALMLKQIVEEGKANAIVIHYHTDEAEKAVMPYLIMAAEKGIAVIDINSDKISYPYPLHAVVGVKQRAATKKLGEAAARSFKGKSIKVGIIEGEAGPISAERVGGFLDGIKGAGMKVVASTNGHWNTEAGYKATMDMMKKNPDIKVIFGACDYSALGAASALSGLGKKDVEIYGYDGEPDAIQKISEGKIKGTAMINPLNMGETAGQVVLDIFSGKFKGGYVENQAIIIDKSNATSYMKNQGSENIKEISVVAQSADGLANEDKTGLYWDIVRAVYEPNGIAVKAETVPYKRGIAMLTGKNTDAMLGLSKLETANIIYPQWHFTAQSVVAMYKKSKIPNWKGEPSLVGKQVAWIRGYDYDKYLTVKISKEEKTDRIPTVLMLEANRIDVYMDNYFDLMKGLKNNAAELQKSKFDINNYAMPEVLSLKLYLGFSDTPKGRALAKIFDDRIPELVASGKLKKLFESYNYGTYPFK